MAIYSKASMGNRIWGHDSVTVPYHTLISQKLGHPGSWTGTGSLCGGDLSEPTDVASLPAEGRQYLLDLERKTFLELCMQRKTLERLQSIITSGKVLRN